MGYLQIHTPKVEESYSTSLEEIEEQERLLVCLRYYPLVAALDRRSGLHLYARLPCRSSREQTREVGF